MPNTTISPATPTNEKAKRADWGRADWEGTIACLKDQIDDVQYQISELKDERDALEADLEEAEEALENCPDDDDDSNEDED
jgi:hypothetical protein